MRTLAFVLITLLVPSCELKPGPKQQVPATAAAPPDAPPPPPGVAATPPSAPSAAPHDGAGAPAAAAAPAAPAVPTAPTAPAGAGSGAAAPTEECLQLGARIASTLIDGADPTQRGQLEQERTRIVRRAAEACTRDTWSAESKACFLAATTPVAMQECGKKLRAP